MVRDMTPADGAGVYTAWKKFGANTTVRLQAPLTLPVAGPVQLAPNDPNRVALMVSNHGGGSVVIGIGTTTAALGMITLADGAAPFIILVRDFGELVCMQWFGKGAAGDTDVVVVEVVGEP